MEREIAKLSERREAEGCRRSSGRDSQTPSFVLSSIMVFKTTFILCAIVCTYASAYFNGYIHAPRRWAAMGPTTAKKTETNGVLSSVPTVNKFGRRYVSLLRLNPDSESDSDTGEDISPLADADVSMLNFDEDEDEDAIGDSDKKVGGGETDEDGDGVDATDFEDDDEDEDDEDGGVVNEMEEEEEEDNISGLLEFPSDVEDEEDTTAVDEADPDLKIAEDDGDIFTAPKKRSTKSKKKKVSLFCNNQIIISLKHNLKGRTSK